MLNEILKEIEELKQYKQKYEYAMKDKQSMSDSLFEFMTDKYNNTSFEERVAYHKEVTCKVCRFRDDCEQILPKDIGKPNKSDKGWIPQIKSCNGFQWS